MAQSEIVISAADLAPSDLRSEEPVAGKWWLRRDAQDWGARGGTILMTGRPTGKPSEAVLHQVMPRERFVPYRVPPIEVDPRARGWHRIYAGIYQDSDFPVSRRPPAGPQARLLARLSGEPYPEYLQAPHRSRERVVEVLWKAADLTGRTIRLEQASAPMPHTGCGELGGISHLRLVPMTDAEVAAAKQEIHLPPAERRLFGILDTTDEIFWWGSVETEDDIRAIVYRHAQAGFGRIYLRCYGTHLDNSLAVPAAAPHWSDADEARWLEAQQARAGWKAYMGLARRFDWLHVAATYGREAGCDVHAAVRFTNYNREPFANFWHDHPEFYAQMLATEKDPKTGKPVTVKPYQRRPYRRLLSFAYPEVRAYYVQFFHQIARSGTRGIMIDLLRHPPIAGYEPIVTEAFQKQYGMPMEERDVYHDPLVQEHLSGYFRQFLVDLRAAIGNEIELSVRCSGPDKFALRGKEWIAEGLINTIVDGHWYSGNGVRPTIDATVAAVGSRGQALACAETTDVDPHNKWKEREGPLSEEAILALAKEYSGRGVARFGVYESTLFTYYPDLRRAIRAAGWSYDPSKR